MNMNMLDEGVENRVVTRDDFPHLSDVEWAAVGRLTATIGVLAVSAMLLGLSADEQHSAVAKFLQQELDASRAEIASLHQQQQQTNAAVGGSMRTPRPETLKYNIAKFKGVDGDPLMRWFVELDRAIECRGLITDDMKVSFGLANLAGRAKTWGLRAPASRPTCVWVV